MKDESTASWYLGVLTAILEAGASRRCYLPEFFSKSAIPPWGLNREVFCLWMFSLFYFYKEMRKTVPFLSLFLQQFWQQGQVQAGDERLRAKASGQVAGL